MSDVFKDLSIEVDKLDSIENWNDKITKMKEIKEKILGNKDLYDRNLQLSADGIKYVPNDLVQILKKHFPNCI